MAVETPFRSAGEGPTRRWGTDLGGRLPAGTVVGLAGDLGAGKTVLADGLLHGAGLDPSVRVTSPTFTLVNRYPGRLPYAHVDLYRLESASEAIDAGIEEIMLDPGNGLVVVEWFDKLPQIWPPCFLRLDIEIESRRVRVIRAGGAHG